jgi:hypothetical protein
MPATRKVALVVLDGWGIGAGDRTDAIAQARTPRFHELLAHHPHATLLTDGEHVGLPAGQMGNSEVGHLNIGAGRVVFQDLVRVDKAVADGSTGAQPVLQEAFQAPRCGRERGCTSWAAQRGRRAQPCRTTCARSAMAAVQAGVQRGVRACLHGRARCRPAERPGLPERFLAGVQGTAGPCRQRDGPLLTPWTATNAGNG